jgi:Acetyltransferase (GNAT) domain
MTIHYDAASVVTRDELPEVSNLLKAVFPTERDWDLELPWQYLENPSGLAWRVNARTVGGELVGHYALIPLPRLSDPKMGDYHTFLSLNTAVHPKAQGKGVFRASATLLYDHLAALHPTVVLGVANANSVHGFTSSLGFFHLGKLDLRFFLPWQTPLPRVERALAAPAEVLAWRATRPGVSSLRMKKYGVLSRVRKHKGITVEGILTVGADGEAVRGLSCPERSPFAVALRLYACSGNHLRGGIPVPERIRPSQLHYICRVLPSTNAYSVINFLNRTRFEFLDFDVM